MNTKTINFVMLFVIILFSSCGPNEVEIQTMLAETITALPSFTPLPTYTSYPTLTPVIVIVTPTVSPTPTSTLTPTNPPYSPQQMTATVVAKTKEYKELFVSLSYNELRDYPDSHVGEKIKVKGRAMQIVDNHTMLAYYAGTYDLFYIDFIPELSEVYENNNIVVYGEVEGNYCYPTTIGGTNCVMKMTCFWYE